MRLAIWLAGIVGAGATAIYLLSSGASQPTIPQQSGPRHVGSDPAPIEPGNTTPVQNHLAEAAIELTKAGWSKEAAERVCQFHQRWLSRLHELDRDAFHLTVQRLTELPRAAELTGLLTHHPEWAGLLLLVDNPVAIARELERPNGDVLASLFLIHLDRADASLLGQALPGNGELIASLIRRGLFGVEHLFIFPRDRPGAGDYERWLTKTLRAALALPDDELGALVFLLLDHGPLLRKRLEEKPEFRGKIDELWQKLMRVIGRTDRRRDLTNYIDTPGLWEFLERPEAEKLLADWDLVPVELLNGRPRLPPHTHKRVIELLTLGDNQIVELLIDNRHEPAFHAFLERPINLDLLRGVQQNLATFPEDQRRKQLELLQSKLALSEDKLRDVVDPKPAGLKALLPFHSVFKLFEKISDGDPVGVEDALFALVDVATTVAPVGKVTVLLPKPSSAVPGSAKTLVRTTGEQIARERLGRLTKIVVPNRFARTQTASWFYRQKVLLETKKVATSEGSKLLQIDITALTQFFFKKSGMGRESFKRLTALEARLFMRRDARVFLRLRVPKATTILRRLFENMVDQWTDDAAEQMHQDAPQPVNAPPRPVDERQTWAEQSSVLWLASAAGLLPSAEPNSK